MMLIAFLVFMGLLFAGVPIAFSMGLGSLVGLLVSGNSLAIVGQRLFAGVNSFSLMAIPFFMLSGELMDKGGISRRLVNFAHALVGHITGGLGMVDILTSIIFAGVSGSAAADTAAIGSIMIPPMKERGYPKGLAAVIQATAGSLGPIIPPSLTMIIYCSLTNQSIGELFMAGILPGLVIGIGTMFVTYLYAKKLGIRGERRATGREVLKATKDAILAIVMPLIIIGGIVGGLFTATEAGAIAVLYALVVGLFVFREFTIKDLPRLLLNSAATSSMALLIVAAANVFSWLVAYAKLPTIIIGFLVSLTSSKYIIMILLVLFLLFVGMFIETLSATIICAPILMPVAAQYGIDPVQFALIMVVTLVYAGVTPPVGGVLFITMGVADAKMKDTLPYLPAFLGMVCLVLLLLIFVPPISTLLPSLLFH
jgi:tripartite ATP-independent transporter DctM subunit